MIWASFLWPASNARESETGACSRTPD